MLGFIRTPIAVATTDVFYIFITVTCVEPVCLGLSPFTWSGEKQEACMYGVNQIQLQYSLDATFSRFISTASSYVTTIAAGFTNTPNGGTKAAAFSGCKLLLQYYQFTEDQAVARLPSVNVVPYYEIPYALTQSGANSAVTAGSSSAITSALTSIGWNSTKIVYISKRTINCSDYFRPNVVFSHYQNLNVMGYPTGFKQCNNV